MFRGENDRLDADQDVEQVSFWRACINVAIESSRALLMPWVIGVMSASAIVVMFYGVGPFYSQLPLEDRIKMGALWLVSGSAFALTVGAVLYVVLFRRGIARAWGTLILPVLYGTIILLTGVMVRVTGMQVTFQERLIMAFFDVFQSVLIYTPVYMIAIPNVEAVLRRDHPKLTEALYDPEFDAINGLLPVTKRGKVAEISISDKTVQVRTDKGVHILRMTLSEATTKVASSKGAQLHRSYWIRFEEIDSLFYQEGNPRVRLKDGSTRPISRAKLPLVKDALSDRV
ncbi:MAG: LytTR family DNA-binding domain-containing protein [Pseudomonadota bacterium]